MGCTPSSKKGESTPSQPSRTTPTDVHHEAPTWSTKILSSGADKDIVAGTYKGLKVAVCVAKTHSGGWKRIQNEIRVFKAVGQHPHIIQMYCSGLERGALYLALEIVEPIGYDLDRLKNMYSFARQVVPSSLMARIYRQLVGALNHMHMKGFIHRDLKTENVLVDAKHNAKLIDMGIACKTGAKECLRAGYLAPELCSGTQPLGVKVDTWGLGIILHQVYQNQWKLLSESGPVEMLTGRPSISRPMEKPVRDAMYGLLKFDTSERWNLKDLLESEWLQDQLATQEVSEDWHQPVAVEDTERRYLRKYVGKKPLPTALAVFITRKNHEHLIDQSLNSLGLSSELGITVLLISYGRGSFEGKPGADTPIKENCWVYFGVPQGEELFSKAVAGLEAILLCKAESGTHRSASPADFRALSKQEVFETGKLVEFTVEFDCFSFPAHIGAEAVLGARKPDSAGESRMLGPESTGTTSRELNLRRVFKLNLVGVQRIGEEDPEWFPRASAIIRPDDFGLVLRQPCLDGSTQPTVTDEDLECLMQEPLFLAALEASPTTSAATTARSFKAPELQGPGSPR